MLSLYRAQVHKVKCAATSPGANCDRGKLSSYYDTSSEPLYPVTRSTLWPNCIGVDDTHLACCRMYARRLNLRIMAAYVILIIHLDLPGRARSAGSESFKRAVMHPPNILPSRLRFSHKCLGRKHSICHVCFGGYPTSTSSTRGTRMPLDAHRSLSMMARRKGKRSAT